MNSSTIILSSQLNLAQTYVTRYLMIPVYIFGNIVYVTCDSATSSQTKSPDRQAIEGFIYAFTIHLCYISASFPFAIYTLASSIFRKECMSRIRRLYTKVLHFCA
ncbi:unnamed protein product [Adineta steineri]|uniref:Uncharacterized protein n=1 Tax=Adineta steineri TaxID=433720 RepID=A0A816EQP3_9BILA|nr:unnamed protein product [Adineta steineri]CAF1649138.1 unnamed protein product [Adineta steineri]